VDNKKLRRKGRQPYGNCPLLSYEKRLARQRSFKGVGKVWGKNKGPSTGEGKRFDSPEIQEKKTVFSNSERGGGMRKRGEGIGGRVENEDHLSRKRERAYRRGGLERKN